MAMDYTGGEDQQAPPVDMGAQIDQEKQEADFLAEITRDYKRLQAQKSRKTGGVEARVLSAKAFEWGEQTISQRAGGLVIEPHEDNKLYLRFNLIGPAKEKLSGRLTSIGMQFYARADKKDPQAQADAEVVDKLILALDEKVGQYARSWELIDWLLCGGTAFEYVPWIPNATIEPVAQFDANNEVLFFNTSTQEITTKQDREQAMASGVPPEVFEIYEEVENVGDVGSEILGPLNVFIDQSVRSVEDLAPDQAIYIAKIRTLGWCEENFEGKMEGCSGEKELKIVTTTLLQDGEATASLYLKDMIPTIQGEQGEDDPPMYVVVERYQPASKKRPHGRYTVFIPTKRVLLDGDNPYEEIPIVDFHFKPVTTTFWTKDYVTDLIPPQKFLNKRISQLGEQANSSIYTKILLGGSLTASDVPSDKPGVIPKSINEQGQPLVQLLPGPQLPGWFLESINLVSKLFGQIAGGADLMQDNKFPGQLRGSEAVGHLQEILDTEWGMLYQHLGQRMARVKQMRVNRVKQFYPPLRTLHYTDRNERDEVLAFHNEKILKAGNNFNITVERGSLLPEMRMLREDRVTQRLNSPLGILYTDDRTGRLDKSKIAADLNMGDYGREGREAQARKFAQQLIEKMWKGERIPPVMPFWDHEPMLDELEASMMTTEFLSASQQIYEIFQDRWQQHVTFLQQRAQQQEASMQNGMMRSALANATQQVAAKTAAEVTDAAQQQIRAGINQAGQQPSPMDMIKAQSQGIGGQQGPQPQSGGPNGNPGQNPRGNR